VFRSAFLPYLAQLLGMISLAEHNSEAIIRYLIFQFLVKSAFQEGL